MKKPHIIPVVTSILLLLCSTLSFAATDGMYTLTQGASAWDGTFAGRLLPVTADYNHTYGDENSVTYSLPWTFLYYGQTYNQINTDTNGNIWFTATGSASSFSLPNPGKGSVISAWNNDLSSYYYSGVFIQHKTNPERVVVEWKAETYTDEGMYLPNDIEAVLFPSGEIRFDYHSFLGANLRDYGSGISKDDNQHYLNLTALYGNAYTQTGRSYIFTSGTTTPTLPGPPIMGSATGGNAQATVTFSSPANDGGSTITGYAVSSSPAGGTDTNAGTTTTTHTVTGLTSGISYTFTVTATNSMGTGPASAASNPVIPAGSLTVTASAGSYGAVTPGNSTVNYGDTLILTITPQSGYMLSTLTDNGSDRTNSAIWNQAQGNYTYTLTNITTNHTIAVTFTPGIPGPVATPALSTTAITLLMLTMIGLIFYRMERRPIRA